MARRILVLAVALALGGCSVAGMAGDAAIGTGQVVLGAADLVI